MPEGDGGTPPTALVTDAGRGCSLSIIRSLGRSGWRVVAADLAPTSPGFQSRYTSERWIYPSPRDSPREFADAVLEAVRRYAVDLVLPTTDDTVHSLAGVRDRFEGLCTLGVAEPEALALVSNKHRTLELARELGVPTPRTCHIRSVADARRAAGCLEWPAVVKPESSRHYEVALDRLDACPVTYARDAEDLLDQVGRVDGRYGLLVQEYCRGDGIGVEMLAQRGRPLLAFQHRRLAEIPVTGGASAWRESVPLDGELYDYALRLVQALEWTGPIMVEFKKGERPFLMEINGRVWGSMTLAVMSGVDFPIRWAELCLDPSREHPAAPSGYDVGVRAYNLDHLLIWIGNVLMGRRRFGFLPGPRRREALRALGCLVSRRERWDFAARDDPRPARAELGMIPRRLARRLVKRASRGEL